MGSEMCIRDRADNNIKIGVPTILSGRVAQLGISVSNALKMATSNFNNAGGLEGRNIELIIRDSRAKPDEAARVCRDFINSDKVDAIINAEASEELEEMVEKNISGQYK